MKVRHAEEICITDVEPIGIPSKVRHAEEVLQLHNAYKYLTERLRRTKQVYNDMQKVERAYDTLEASNIPVDEKKFGEYMDARGKELVALYNKTSY